MILELFLESDIDAEDLLKISNRIKHKVLNKPEEGLISILKIKTTDELDEDEIFSLVLELKVLDIFVDYWEIH